jgi:two-component system chemotaxis response regulator CheB
MVLHVGAHRSLLPDLLNRQGPLRASHAVDGERLERGRIYIAPPDHHMRLDGELVRVARGPKEHHARPAIDPLFRSAALAWNEQVIGVVLTGLLDDGTSGMQSIKARGGTAIVQDPSEAEAPSMPQSVLRHVAVDHCLGLAELVPVLCTLVATSAATGRIAMPSPAAHEEAVALGIGDPMAHLAAIGSPSTFTCPDCHGTLWQIADTSPRRFRCHTGHAFTLETLRATQGLATDEALWSSIRALQEKRELTRLAEEAAVANADAERATELHTQAERLERAANELRELVEASE